MTDETAPTTTEPETTTAPSPEAPAEATAPEPPKYRLIAAESRRFDFPLTVEERARIGDRVGDLGRRLRELERVDQAETEQAAARIAAAKSDAREEAGQRRQVIAEAAEAFDVALEAQTTGVERRAVPVERRGVVATATIEIVRTDTGEVVEARPMTEAEQARWCRQGDIEEATGGATVRTGIEAGDEGQRLVVRNGVIVKNSYGFLDLDRYGEGEAGALGLPTGWPRSWSGQTWDVGDGRLDEAGVREVYLRLTTSGVTIGGLLDGTASVQGLATMGIYRSAIGRALSLLRGKGLAARGEGRGVWVLVERAEPAPEPEPGRTDTLPEAGDAPRVRRIGKRATKADRIVNDAVGQSDGWGLSGTVPS